MTVIASDILSQIREVGPHAVIVSYNGFRLLPAPLIDFTVEPQFDGDGNRESTTTRIVLTGSILIQPSGSYELLYAKQEKLRQVFSVDNADLLILAGPNNVTLPPGTIISSGIKPKVKSINVPADPQFNRIDYTIDLEDSTAASGVSGVVSDFSNTWSFREDADTCTLEVTHTVSAKGLEGEDDAFENALTKVRASLGIDKLPIQLPSFTEPNASGGFSLIHPSNPAGGPIFEISVSREEEADVANGSYNAKEVFRIVSGVPFFYTRKNGSFSTDTQGTSTVTIEGTVQGLGRTLRAGDPLGSLGYERAASGFINQIRPQIPWEASGLYIKYKEGNVGSGLFLTRPQSVSVSENRCQGQISFSYSYTDNPADNVPSGIITLSTEVSRTEGIRLIASHPIPLRRLGNLLQDIQTTIPGTVTINANSQAANTGDYRADVNRAIAAIQDEINRLRHIHADPNDFITLRITNLQRQINEKELSANASITYEFTIDLANAPSPNADISLGTI